MASVLYNEFDPKAAAWLRWLVKEKLIPDGDVDERSICDLQPQDVAGYTHVHFFAGIGGWAYASLLAGWPADRPLWTGSCPCQPFSVAGQGRGTDDPRHLWPHFFRLIRACRPPVVVGEQVAGKAGYGWFDGVGADLAGERYACRAVDIPAAAVDSPQIRQRLYWIAVADCDGPRSTTHRGDVAEVSRLQEAQREPEHRAALFGRGNAARGVAGPVAGASSSGSGRGSQQPAGDINDRAAAGRLEGPSGASGGHEGGDQVDAEGERRGGTEPVIRGGRHAAAGSDVCVVDLVDAEREGLEGHAGHVDDRAGWPQPDRPVAPTDERNGTFWSDADRIQCHDGKARRVADAGSPLLAHGIPGRVVAWRGFGNAIVPQEAAEVLSALMETVNG